MSYPVTYYCPRCGTLVDLDREGYLDDKAVTPYPLEGWSYATPDESFEDGVGVRFACGDDDAAGVEWRAPPGAEDDPSENEAEESDASDVGCGEPFYLSFVRFEDGEEVDPRPPSERVELADGSTPAGPGTPEGPRGPDNSGGGFYE